MARMKQCKISWGDQDAVARMKQLGARLQISASFGFASLFFRWEIKPRKISYYAKDFRNLIFFPQKAFLKKC